MPRYPTREELAAGAEPIAAVPRSFWLRVMTTGLGHKLDIAAVYLIGRSFISWEASRLRGIEYQPSLLLTTVGASRVSRAPACCPSCAIGAITLW